MSVRLPIGLEHLDLAIEPDRLVPVQRGAEPVPLHEPATALRLALENPVDFPALRRAITPDDQLAVVIDEHLPSLGWLVTQLCEYLETVGVAPEAITLLTTRDLGLAWLDALPDAWQEIRVETHNPSDRKQLAYLATAKTGQRVYLNRTLVEADQSIILTKREYDPLLGYAGLASLLYPGLADEAAQKEVRKPESFGPPFAKQSPARELANQMAWLLGVPFFVQVVPGWGDSIASFVTGPTQSAHAGDSTLDRYWHVTVPTLADTVVVSLTGDPTQHTFLDLAKAVSCAAEVVKPEGRIVLLSPSTPSLGTVRECLAAVGDANLALEQLAKRPATPLAALLWARSAQHAHIYWRTELSEEVAEEMFAEPFADPKALQRLLHAPGTVLLLPDAHKTWAECPS